MIDRRPSPDFSGPLMQRRKLGERIGLLVIAAHDADAGWVYADRSNAARIVLAETAMPHELDWSCAVALDCLIVGDCDESVFYAVATMLFASGAASIWGEFPDGVYRLERWHVARFGFWAGEGPYAAGHMGRALSRYRAWALMTRAGVYGTKLFDAARDALYVQVFGPLASKAQAWVFRDRTPPATRLA